MHANQAIRLNVGNIYFPSDRFILWWSGTYALDTEQLFMPVMTIGWDGWLCDINRYISGCRCPVSQKMFYVIRNQIMYDKVVAVVWPWVTDGKIKAGSAEVQPARDSQLKATNCRWGGSNNQTCHPISSTPKTQFRALLCLRKPNNDSYAECGFRISQRPKKSL